MQDVSQNVRGYEKANPRLCGRGRRICCKRNIAMPEVPEEVGENGSRKNNRKEVDQADKEVSGLYGHTCFLLDVGFPDVSDVESQAAASLASAGRLSPGDP
jgi:hypothetical protein